MTRYSSLGGRPASRGQDCHIDLPTTDGGRFSSESIAADGRPVLLVFGSLTCPVTQSAGRGLLDLHRTYGDAIRFVVVNVREAHPGADTPQPRVIDEMMRNGGADQFKKNVMRDLDRRRDFYCPAEPLRKTA